MYWQTMKYLQGNSTGNYIKSVWLDATHPLAAVVGGPLGEERGAKLVNGSKVYNVRFYSASIIHSWKRQERERGKGGQE